MWWLAYERVNSRQSVKDVGDASTPAKHFSKRDREAWQARPMVAVDDVVKVSLQLDAHG